MLVGEAPGKHEEEQLIPFVGPAGKIVDDLLRKTGLDRSDVYITNVVKVRPPDNDLRKLSLIGCKIEDFIPQLWEEVRVIGPNCILALGNLALETLTGHKGIHKYRGSILPNCQSLLPKVVPSIHPASMFKEGSGEKEMRSYKQLAYIQFDFKRAVEQSRFKEMRLPIRSLLVARSSLDVLRFLERNADKDKVSLDVETFKTLPLCIALSFVKHEALSVPLLNILTHNNPEGIPLHDMAYIWKLIAEFIGDTRVKIIGQNLKFDERICTAAGLGLGQVWFDTMLAFGTLWSEFPKSLQFISSVYTEEPYYKDEGSEYNPKKDKLDRLLLYNAKDAAVTYEVFERETENLKEFGLTDFFFSKVMPLHRLYYDLELVGLKVDETRRKELIVENNERDVENDKALCELIGHEINVNSPKQVAFVLFGELKIPPRKDTSNDTLQAVIANVISKQPKKLEIVSRILKGRRIKKNKSTYLLARTSSDGRMRTSYRICGTETGRTSTTVLKPPISVEQQGLAFQTLTKYGDVGSDLRSMFVSDEHYVLMEPDEEQAEDRVVCWLANDRETLEILDRTDFKVNQYGVKDDRHTLTTMLVTGIAFENVTDGIRQIGKRSTHAAHYGVGKHEFTIQINADLAKYKCDLVLSEWKVGQILAKIHELRPKIRNVYHREIEEALGRNSRLISPHGRLRIFFEKWGPELFKEAYAYLPQATVSDHLKFAMLRIKVRAPWILFAVESHDSFLSLVPDTRIDEAYWIIKEEMEVPIDFSECTIPRGKLTIPCGIKVSALNWEKLEKYVLDKQVP